jgi:Protein of unknown function (DUF1552)
MHKRQSNSGLTLTSVLVVLLSACPSGAPVEQPSSGGGAGGGQANGSTGGNTGSTGGGVATGTGGGQGETPADAGTPVDTTPDSGTPGPGRDGGVVGKPAADRILFFYVPHGIDPTKFMPSGTGKNFTLSPLMKALEPYKTELTIVRGQKSAKLAGTCRGPVHFGPGAFFSGTAQVKLPMYQGSADVCAPTSPTIDQVIAQELSQNVRYPSINLGVFTIPPTRTEEYLLENASYVQGDKPTGTVTEPKALIDEVLASNVSPTTIEAFKKLQSAREALGTTLKSAQHYKALGRIDLDLAVEAFRADLTRVAFVHFSMYAASNVGNGRSLRDAAHTFAGETPVDISAYHEWYLSEYAHVLETLKSTPDADGLPMLDHTLVVWVTETGEAIAHAERDIPAIVAGNASGRLNQGQVVTVNGYQVDLFLTLAKALGSKVTTFGDPALGAKPIPEMLK